MSILTYVKSAAEAIRTARAANRAGDRNLSIRAVRRIPCYSMGTSFINTLEYGLVNDREVERAIAQAFETLPPTVQRELLFTPKSPGGWAERALTWQYLLKPILPPRTYYSVISSFLVWYKRCIRRRNLELMKGEI